MCCFAAGTAVTTKRGLVPIDQVCIGELVLSRNPATGETTFKPVLGRTLKPRVPMRKLTAGGEPIVASPGHAFFSNGGWVKVRDLRKDAGMTTEDGSARLAGVDDAAQPMQAYN